MECNTNFNNICQMLSLKKKKFGIIFGLLFCHTRLLPKSIQHLYFIQLRGTACGILVPQPGIKQPVPSTVEAQSFLNFYFFLVALSLCCQESFLQFQGAGRCGEWGLLFLSVPQLLIVGGFSCCRQQALGAPASIVMVHGLSCSMACRIFPDQGLNPCPLHWQTNSYPLCPHGRWKQSLNHQNTREVPATCTFTQNSELLKIIYTSYSNISQEKNLWIILLHYHYRFHNFLALKVF